MDARSWTVRMFRLFFVTSDTSAVTTTPRLEGFVRLTLRAAQYRDAHSTIPLPAASRSA